MRRALNMLRRAIHYRREVFDEGLQNAGCTLVSGLSDPRPDDVLLIWNRYGGFAAMADLFESRGATVLVAENCPLGNSWVPGSWYSLARDHVALTGGDFRPGGPERWASICAAAQERGAPIVLEPFRTGGDELVILAQRGIGHESIRSPDNWAQSVRSRFGGRIREHPGTSADGVPLRDDLARASGVITWSSAAAVQALKMGVPVWYRHEGFVCASASMPLSMLKTDARPNRSEALRLEAFERLAWAMVEGEEIRRGDAIRRLL